MLVIQAHVSGFDILRVLVDTGSSVDIIFSHAFDMIVDKSIHKRLKSYKHEIYGCNNQPVKVHEVITLPLRLGDEEHKATYDIEFLVADCWSPHNMIMRRSSLFAFEVTLSTISLKAKFLTLTGTGVCKGD